VGSASYARLWLELHLASVCFVLACLGLDSSLGLGLSSARALGLGLVLSSMQLGLALSRRAFSSASAAQSCLAWLANQCICLQRKQKQNYASRTMDDHNHLRKQKVWSLSCGVGLSWLCFNFSRLGLGLGLLSSAWFGSNGLAQA
jgi:hypothetical protein